MRSASISPRRISGGSRWARASPHATSSSGATSRFRRSWASSIPCSGIGLGPYHAVILAFHCANAGLLFSLLSSHFTRPAALVGASLFAVHPALFTALYWQSARADILAGGFALSTAVLALRPGRERWLAIPSFALALLSKESTLLLPAVIAVLAWWLRSKPPQVRRTRWSIDPLLLVLFLMSLLYILYLTQAKGVGVKVGFDPAAAYAFDFGPPLLGNLLTYLGWTVDLAMLRPGLRFVDQQNPTLFPFAIGVLMISGTLSLWPTLRRRGWLVGLGSYFLLLVPVLPLRNHAYHYYLYVPLMAAGLCLASLLDALFGRPGALRSTAREQAKVSTRHRAPRQARLGPWLVAGLGFLVLTWNGARLVKQMENRPSPVYPGLRGDPIVDRALIAERAIQSLRAASIPSGTELVFILRERIALIARIVRGSGEHAPPLEEVYTETNVKAALFDGIGLRALVPGVDSVRFALSLGRPTPRRLYAVYAPTGEVQVFNAISIDSLLRSSWVMRW